MRLLLAIMSIVMTVISQQWYDDVLHIMLMIALLFLLEKQHQKVWHICWRSWQMLRWILIPTLVLHALFTPGALIFPQTFLPITHEGLQLGLMLALHWAAIFMLAILLARLFSVVQWLNAMAYFPRFYTLLYPYLRLFPRMNLVMRALIRRHYRLWKLMPHKFMQFPHHLLYLLHRMQYYSKRCALDVWMHWEDAESLVLTHHNSIKPQGLALSVILMVTYTVLDMGVFH